jgi:hypothetical protein
VLYSFCGKLGARQYFHMRLATSLPFVPCWDEIRHQLLAKGTLLIKDVSSLDPAEYFDFPSSHVSLRKRLYHHCIYPSNFLVQIFVNIRFI